MICWYNTLLIKELSMRTTIKQAKDEELLEELEKTSGLPKAQQSPEQMDYLGEMIAEALKRGLVKSQ
jgi:hypothetical protein